MPGLFEQLQRTLADRYRLEREVGTGGMATVYLAEDLRHHRRVALKVLRPELGAVVGGGRFLQEIEVTANLHHPHILPLYDSGEAEGRLYYVMPFVEGESLRGRLTRERQLPLDDALRITAEVADALGYAHQHGVVHRDIKPENILLESAHAIVADFGIARALSAAGGRKLTETGFTVGTPPYMSPEQAAGEADLDARSDLYSLACVLYEMLSGETPYTGPTPLAILAKKLSEPLPRISVVRDTVPPWLESVIDKALARTPADRYQTAGEFAAALASGTFAPGAAGRPWPGRRRALAAAAAVAVAAAGAWGILSGRLRGRGQEPAVIANNVPLTSESGVEIYPSLSPDGKWVVYAGAQSGNRDIFLRAVGGRNAINLTRDSPDDDDEPAFSADGERIAFRSARDGGGIFVMGRTGEAVRRVTKMGFRPTWSPEGTRIAFATEDVPLNPQNAFGRSDLWVVTLGSGALQRLDSTDAVLPSWSPHGHRIAFTRRLGNPPQVDVWTVSAGGGQSVAATSDKFADWNPAWSPDGRFLYFVSDRGGTMNLWRVPIDERSGRTRGSPEPVTVPTQNLTQISVAGGGEIAYSSVSNTMNIQEARLDPVTDTVVGEPTWVTTGSNRWSSPDPSRDGKWVAFYQLDRGDIHIAHPDGTGQQAVTGDSAGDRVPRWSPDGTWLAFFSSRARTIQVWKIRPDGSELRQLTDAAENVGYATWSPDGRRMTATQVPHRQSRVFVFDPDQPWASASRQELPAAPEALQPYYINSWSRDGRWLCGAVLPMNGILTYDTSSRRFERLTDYGEWPTWFPDGRHIIFVSGPEGAGKAIYVVDRATKRVRKILAAGRDVLGPPRLSADGRRAYFTRRVTEADIWLVTLR